MIATSARLLTTSGPVVNAVVCRNAYITAFQQEFKIARTKDPPARRSALRELRKVSSMPELSRRQDPTDARECLATAAALTKRTTMETDPSDASPAAAPAEISSNLKEYLASRKLDEESDEPPVAFGAKDEHGTASGCRARRPSMSERKYKAARAWRALGSATAPSKNPNAHFVVKVLSYNILAQNLLESHKYLYREHNRESLDWSRRMTLVQKEILEADANVVCLQEVLVDHLEDFLRAFTKAGYNYVYKMRTHDKRDGLLLLYRTDQLTLVDHTEVELYQPNVDILNRDNVAIVAKFSLLDSPETQIVVATTHLLYNPRRNDVRLAQTQLLFAELEKTAFVKFTEKGARYLPIILCGDFNLPPYTAVYRFITEGRFEFRGKNRSLEPAMLCGLGDSLIPPSLLVTDNCQFYDVLMKRFQSKTDDAPVKADGLRNDPAALREPSNADGQTEKAGELNTRTFAYQNVKIVDGQYAKFSSGSLTHPFSLSSVYEHANANGESEATTNQDEWITVDYIFYSGVEPLSKYNLPTVSECESLPTIPNNVVGSDHLCLGASFRLTKKKR